MPVCSQQTQTESIDRTVEFMGIELNPAYVTNIHLKRVIGRISHEKFKFSYDNHSRHNYGDYSDIYRDWGEKYHEELPYDKWSEASYLDVHPFPYDQGMA